MCPFSSVNRHLQRAARIPVWIGGATQVAAAPAGTGSRSTPRKGLRAFAAAVSRSFAKLAHPAAIRANPAFLVKYPS